MERRLTAILSADVVGYSRLMGANEIATLEALKALRADLLEPCIAEHNGRTFKLTGDGTLVEFPSVVSALECGLEIQRDMRQRNSAIADDRKIEFRIGIELDQNIDVAFRPGFPAHDRSEQRSMHDAARPKLVGMLAENGKGFLTGHDHIIAENAESRK